MSEVPHAKVTKENQQVFESLYRYFMDHAPLLVALFFIFGIYQDVRDLKADRYTLPMASEDAMREALANPGHRVPDPRNPGQYFVVEEARIINHPQVLE